MQYVQGRSLRDLLDKKKRLTPSLTIMMGAAIAAALAEVGATISPVGAKQMGLVMKATQARLNGKTVDGKALSEKVRAKLSA